MRLIIKSINNQAAYYIAVLDGLRTPHSVSEIAHSAYYRELNLNRKMKRLLEWRNGQSGCWPTFLRKFVLPFAHVPACRIVGDN